MMAILIKIVEEIPAKVKAATNTIKDHFNIKNKKIKILDPKNPKHKLIEFLGLLFTSFILPIIVASLLR